MRGQSQSVGIIGVGDIGSGIATALVNAGFRTRVFDLDRGRMEPVVQRGAYATTSVSELVADSEVVSIAVLDDLQVHQVVREVLRRPGRVHTVLVHSTVLPRTVQTLDAEAASTGVSIVDAPVSGGSDKGALGQLTLIVGADQESFRRVEPILHAMASSVFHVGPVGAGSAGKLVNNLLSLGGHVLQLEAMRLAAAYGIDEESATDFIVESAGDSRGIRTWGRLDRIRTTHTLAGTPEMYDFFAKDLRTAALAAAHRDLVLPATSMAAALIGPAMAARDRQRKPDDLRRIPRCAICDQELARPFRRDGVHPECRATPATGS